MQAGIALFITFPVNEDSTFFKYIETRTQNPPLDGKIPTGMSQFIISGDVYGIVCPLDDNIIYDCY